MLPHSGSRTETLRDWRQALQRRSLWLLAAFALWLIFLAVRLVLVMVVQRHEYLARLESSAWRVGTVPALRGRLLDRDGVPLAWSVRYFRLTYRVPATSTLVEAEAQVLAAALGVDRVTLLQQVLPHRGTTMVLREQLAPAEVERVRGLVAALDDCQLVSGFNRITAPGANALLGQLGHTRVYGQREVGVSGWERDLDEKLRGQDGKYRVMVDKYDRWIPETWEELRPPCPGYDAYAPQATGLAATAAPPVATVAATPAKPIGKPVAKATGRRPSTVLAATPSAFTP